MLKPPLHPMLLSRREKPFNSEHYLFEFKWDGYRCLYFFRNGKTFVQSRNYKDLLPAFPELEQVSQFIDAESFIMDGEICYFNSEGQTDIGLLQQRFMQTKKSKIPEKRVTLIVWDLLSINGQDIYLKPLKDRKKQLNAIVLEENEVFYLSPYLLAEGKKLYEIAQNKNMEGIVAKQLDSPYEFKRSKYWHKIKLWQYTEALIAGYTRNFSSLAVIKEGIFIGKVKPALPASDWKTLCDFLPSIKTNKPEFTTSVNQRDYKNIIWVKQAIKCKIRYTEITSHHTFRHGYITKLILT